MTKLPRDVPGKKVIAALEKLGFSVRRVSGSHYLMVRGTYRTIVPYHKAVRTGTLKSILKQAGLSADEINDLL